MSVVQEFRELLRLRAVQLSALAGLAAAVIWHSMQLKYCVIDLDLWWHIAVGDWITQHLAVPHAGIFSWTAANRPWVAYSWGYEVLLSRAFAWGGLLGVGLFGVVLTIAVGYTVFWMLHRLSGRFWVACLLAVAACSAFLFTIMPRPVFFSMILFAITLTLLLEAQRSGRVQQLYWLPPIFLLWANLHIQFVYGLFVVGLLLAVNLMQQLAATTGIAPECLSQSRISVKRLALVFGACLIATCFGPYSFQLYRVIFEYSKAKLPYSVIIELQPLSFHYANHYAQLLLTAAAFFTVGWQKKIDPFKLALLVFASAVAFRTMRDGWFVCTVAAACIADVTQEQAERDRMETPAEMAGLAVAMIALLFLMARNTDFSKRDLDRAITGNYPVYAANFLRRNPVPGPLYNELNWGGFLIWYLPQYPVAIDGRNDLYGDELDGRFIRTQNGEDSYVDDPYLNGSGVVLLPKGSELAGLLRNDSRFNLIYQDDTAVVFARSSPAMAYPTVPGPSPL